MSTKARVRLLPEAIAWDGVVRNTGDQRLLLGYVRAHPRRFDELKRLVPEAARGLRVHGSVRDGRLLVERLSLKGDDDPLLEMVLWHTLFPGLRAPLVAWWMNGPFCLSTAPPDMYVTVDEEREGSLPEREHTERHVHFRCGYIVAAPALSDGIGAPFLWPLPARLLVAPLVVLHLPFAMIGLYLEALRGRDAFVPWWFFLCTPLFMVAVLLHLVVPGLFNRYMAPLVHRITEHALQLEAVSGLVKDALHQDLPRSLSK